MTQVPVFSLLLRHISQLLDATLKFLSPYIDPLIVLLVLVLIELTCPFSSEKAQSLLELFCYIMLTQENLPF